MKKTVGIIGSIIAIVVVGFGIIKFKEYYENRYVAGDDVFVRIPDSQSVTLDDIVGDDESSLGKGKMYILTGYTEKGDKRDVEFTVYTKNAAELFQPGQYLKVEASDILVLGQKVISESEVPANVLKLLNQ
ncbi:YxeA family protein [Erysipelothrix sp. HDW6A]|uniref:YxeA family protein n=1 Tax=Erysipelothrix sp. HDW6A TaxID=2714928 RepID=UPI00140E1E44|nr:YxeA family protein [Erysipelothrix sp. HDW6A]QIK58101.1 YxeA family protein [Erysipelothrix sp. HDW6A]